VLLLKISYPYGTHPRQSKVLLSLSVSGFNSLWKFQLASHFLLKKIGFLVFPTTFLAHGGDGYFLEQHNVLSLSLNKSVAQLSK